MNKGELIDEIANTASLSKTDATKALDSFIGAVTKELKKGGEIRLVGFGTFDVTRRKAKEGRNPRTGETIKIPAANRPRFKVGKALKDAVN